MNIKMMRYVLGRLLLVEAALMALPLSVMLIYGELAQVHAILIPMALLALLGTLAISFKPKEQALRATDGFVTVGLSWILLSLFGALPFVLSGLIPNYIDALFETISGFTTTGSSVLLQRILQSSGPPNQALSVCAEFSSGAALQTGSAVWECWFSCWQLCPSRICRRRASFTLCVPRCPDQRSTR